MTTTIIIPWRDSGDQHRKKSFDFIERSIRRMLPEAVVRLSDADPSAPFNRGASRNAGVYASLKSEVVVLLDADTLPDQHALEEAIYQCQVDGRMHLPYTLYRCLTPSATKKALRGHVPLESLKSEMDTEWAGSGCLVMTPKAFFLAGGQPEFVGWGFEDSIFKICADALLGQTVRHTGSIHHLWHPILWTTDDADYIRNREEGIAYDKVEGDREAILELISRREK